jgi:hypothetical protein
MVATYMWDLHGGGFTMEPIRQGLGEIGIAVPLPGADTTRMERLAELWTTVGLTDVETRRIDITIGYEDFDDFWGANTSIHNSVSNAVASLSPAEVETLMERVHAILPTDETGRVAYGAHANAVKGIVR